jgi:hypothetical protein
MLAQTLPTSGGLSIGIGMGKKQIYLIIYSSYPHMFTDFHNACNQLLASFFVPQRPIVTDLVLLALGH